MMNMINTIPLSDFLDRGRELRASDIHLSEGQPAAYRVHGALQKDGDILTADTLERLLATLWIGDVSPLIDDGSIDFGYSDENGHRYRVNAYRSMGVLALALRFLENNFTDLQSLHLPQVIGDLAKAHSGLILVCGATGSGKSTTLAALINQINQQRPVHILTIEDPVEFIHPPQQAVVHQRELGRDFLEFPHAVRAALREDPDILMVGEMRDLDTVRAAMTAAETGHLVLSTLHTNDAVSSVERLIGAFPGNEQDLCRTRLSRCLRAVIAQRLIPTANGLGRVPAVEILLENPAVSNLIENDKTRQLYSAIESNRQSGMQTLDQSLADLVSNRWITLEVAQHYAKQPHAITDLISQAGR
jgi:twitching motility protein PilT